MERVCEYLFTRYNPLAYLVKYRDEMNLTEVKRKRQINIKLLGMICVVK